MKKYIWLFIIIISIISISFLVSNNFLTNEEKEEKVTTIITLEKIINKSELNTFQAIYNGIAEVNNEQKRDELDFYVSYKSKIQLGFDIKDIKIEKNDVSKKIIVNIPEVEIKKVNVDIGTLDFMFLNDKSNERSVTERAYKACIKDAKEESKNKKEIYKLANQNANNIIKALINPFVKDFDEEYTIEIN